MNEYQQSTLMELTVGGLLHDIGKVIQRAHGARVPHSKYGADWLHEQTPVTQPNILDQVRYHHAREIRQAKQPISPLAYITYIADNIASGIDRRSTEANLDEEYAQTFKGFDSKVPLQSVFKLLHPQQGETVAPTTADPERAYYLPTTLKTGTTQDDINYPGERRTFSAEAYGQIVDQLKDNLKQFELSPSYINSLLQVIEANLFFVPSDTSRANEPDISLYEHVKLTACMATCIYSYCQAHYPTQDYQKLLFDQEAQFNQEPMALLVNLNLSGIQAFIYNIQSKYALKNLRARSFYLEILMEQLIDTVLNELHLSRAQLMYSGGGSAYLILPNTALARTRIDQAVKNCNQWLLAQFGTSLFMAHAYEAVSVNTFKTEPEIAFQAVSRAVSEKKRHRYSYEDIVTLNQKQVGRECNACQAMVSNKQDTSETLAEGLCQMCHGLIQFKHADFYAITQTALDTSSVPLMNAYLTAVDETTLRKLLQADAIQTYYSKNTFYQGNKLATRLLVGDHAYTTDLEDYAKASKGIDRMGVVRMDVDNLGTAFVSGFEPRFRTLARTSMLSRSLSLFFKLHINHLLTGQKITVVYSGGDDMFLIGSWDDIYRTSRTIAAAFERFTMGKLTLSAGVGIYPGKYPVHLMATETALLEKAAKNNANQSKNSVSLFTPELTFKWTEFDSVMDKLRMIEGLLSERTDKGNGFLYKVLELIRGQDSINIARLAYLLATENIENTDFRDMIMDQRPIARKAVVAAISLYVYANREEEIDATL